MLKCNPILSEAKPWKGMGRRGPISSLFSNEDQQNILYSKSFTLLLINVLELFDLFFNRCAWFHVNMDQVETDIL